MFEQFPMIHYEFSFEGDGIEDLRNSGKELSESHMNTVSPILEADYMLRGYVDVLPYIPLPEDVFYLDMHLQSFSHMYSLPDYYTKRTSVSSYLLIHTVHGSGLLEYEEKTYRLQEGDLFWIDCRNPHTYRTDGPFWEHTDIHIGGEGIPAFYEEYKKSGQCVRQISLNPDFMNDLESMLEAYVTPDPRRTLKASHALRTMLVHLVLSGTSPERVSDKSSRSLHKIISYMHEHFPEPLSMDELARQAGFSKYHFSREFRKLTGFPPNEYLIRLRLEEAKNLLINTDLPVSRVAEYAGIENEAYFSRLFHQRMHMTPGTYRKQFAQP